MAHIAVICGSTRAESNSHRISEIAVDRLAAIGATTDLVSLRDVKLPLWDESKGDETAAASSPWRTIWPDVSRRLAAADGVVVVCPEWHGMAPPALKNLLFCCNDGELAFKPAYLIAVSGGSGGAYPVAELRISSYKNNYLHWLPDQLIVRAAGGFRPGEDGHSAPEFLEPRMIHGLTVLNAYAEAARPVRQNVVDLTILKNGM